MISSYRLGLALVTGTLALSAALCAVVNPRPDASPEGENLTGLGHALGPFTLTERSRQQLTAFDLRDRVWIAAFVFSRCPSSCPRISKVMKDMQRNLGDTNVLLVSISVDPDHDTPDVLRTFADRYGASPSRWLFVTGLKSEIYKLILNGFMQSVSEVPAAERKGDIEAISHSDRLSLVGPGNVLLGVYNSTDPKAVLRLEARARFLDRMQKAAHGNWIDRLPALNAGLNALCALLLVAGWGLIRMGKREVHAGFMIMAIVVSVLFLTSYLIYHCHVGSVWFPGQGAIRIAYRAILLSHTVLAVAVVPLVAVTFTLATMGRFSTHARVACVTFPVWLYVSVTGVVVYLMLYQMPLQSG